MTSTRPKLQTRKRLRYCFCDGVFQLLSPESFVCGSAPPSHTPLRDKVQFVRVDTSKYRALGRQYDVQCPSSSSDCKFYMFKKGEPWFTTAGKSAMHELKEQVERNARPSVTVQADCTPALGTGEVSRPPTNGIFAALQDTNGLGTWVRIMRHVDMQREGQALYLRAAIVAPGYKAPTGGCTPPVNFKRRDGKYDGAVALQSL